MLESVFLKEVISIILLSSASVSVAIRQYGACASKAGDCGWNTFKCLDGACIDRTNYCDGYKDCLDNSDEKYCKGSSLSLFRSGLTYSSQASQIFAKCTRNTLYFPIEWKCDGIFDCSSGEDEVNCANSTEASLRVSLSSSRGKAIQWLRNKTVSASATRKWGPRVDKTAVALYLSYPVFVFDNSSAREEITYELSIQLLSRLSQKRIHHISSSDLASFINSFLISCLDPRDFHGFNLVEELRSRVDKQNHTNPYLLLALCNAGDIIKESDVRKLSDIFWNNNRELWTDTQAVALMALSCARNQPDSIVDLETITELALELKNHQYRNGTVESLLSTLLVMQALYSAETDADPDNFDEYKALSYILQNQKPDGSFGNFLLTYYALPVLSCRSLVDISNSHCVTVPKDEDTAMYDLMNHFGPKVQIHYSIWIGMERNIERTLSMRIPVNTSFYGVMEIAAEIDSRYKFEYVVRNRKPYINAVSGILDDPESGQFWFPYTVKDKKASPLEKSTADMIPQADDHIVMWYRKGSWID